MQLPVICLISAAACADRTLESSMGCDGCSKHTSQLHSQFIHVKRADMSMTASMHFQCKDRQQLLDQLGMHQSSTMRRWATSGGRCWTSRQPPCAWTWA